ncbi:DUF2956 domain-containing protein [Colwellia sp. 75C3]|uniref:DUF2956 domain-containing protein n=1 Tax=Colwellia sp. 75C3 TaxID=888425 RepID=UPI000C345868|nr:DUF2956 domain-containing protein [Colwellia sp. 75C3]PKG81082.1 DUF2956 domain-containing protein [Colwellia sp. 75C3]
MNNKVSLETQDQAAKVAKGTQKKGQTKDQTKLIAQGIEKGIAEYKKQQSKKSRERDKDRKQQVKQKQKAAEELGCLDESAEVKATNKLPWFLLGLSWFGFVGYLFLG